MQKKKHYPFKQNNNKTKTMKNNTQKHTTQIQDTSKNTQANTMHKREITSLTVDKLIANQKTNKDTRPRLFGPESILTNKWETNLIVNLAFEQKLTDKSKIDTPMVNLLAALSSFKEEKAKLALESGSNETKQLVKDILDSDLNEEKIRIAKKIASLYNKSDKQIKEIVTVYNISEQERSRVRGFILVDFKEFIFIDYKEPVNLYNIVDSYIEIRDELNKIEISLNELSPGLSKKALSLTLRMSYEIVPHQVNVTGKDESVQEWAVKSKLPIVFLTEQENNQESSLKKDSILNQQFKGFKNLIYEFLILQIKDLIKGLYDKIFSKEFLDKLLILMKNIYFAQIILKLVILIISYILITYKPYLAMFVPGIYIFIEGYEGLGWKTIQDPVKVMSILPENITLDIYESRIKTLNKLMNNVVTEKCKIEFKHDDLYERTTNIFKKYDRMNFNFTNWYNLATLSELDNSKMKTIKTKWDELQDIVKKDIEFRLDQIVSIEKSDELNKSIKIKVQLNTINTRIHLYSDFLDKSKEKIQLDLDQFKSVWDKGEASLSQPVSKKASDNIFNPRESEIDNVSQKEYDWLFKGYTEEMFLSDINSLRENENREKNNHLLESEKSIPVQAGKPSHSTLSSDPSEINQTPQEALNHERNKLKRAASWDLDNSQQDLNKRARHLPSIKDKITSQIDKNKFRFEAKISGPERSRSPSPEIYEEGTRKGKTR